MRLLRILCQVVLLSAVSVLGDYLVRLLHWNVPGSIVGLVLMFALLQFKVVKVEWIDMGASWLISELLLFYVPSAVGIVQYGHLMKLDGLRIVIVIAVSTALVMVSTGVLADRIAKKKQSKTKEAV